MPKSPRGSLAEWRATSPLHSRPTADRPTCCVYNLVLNAQYGSLPLPHHLFTFSSSHKAFISLFFVCHFRKATGKMELGFPATVFQSCYCTFHTNTNKQPGPR